jgi:hypothetical protein
MIIIDPNWPWFVFLLLLGIAMMAICPPVPRRKNNNIVKNLVKRRKK